MVGAAAARWRRSRGGSALEWLLLPLLSILPDADVVGFTYGVAYAAPWGHRGASHSLLIAAALALLFTPLLARRRTVISSYLLLFIVIASHGLIDTLTDGGLGVALLWPWKTTRYFAPWRPIPVAPIGPWMFSARGLHVVMVELMQFAPFLLYALWPRKRRRGHEMISP